VIVASVGDNCVDRYLGVATLELAGGNALNVAAGLSAAGLQSYYLGAVGEDANAELILDGARRANVVTSRIKRLPAPTGVTVVRLRDDGDRVFVEERHGASAGYEPDPGDIAFMRACDWVHCVNLTDPEPLITQLEGVPVSFDFGMESSPGLVARLAPRLEIAFFSGANLDREQAVALGERAVAAGAALAVVTRGRSGSMALNSAIVEVPAQPVEVVDTLGAGDALIAAVVAAQVRGQDIEQALAAGSAAAAQACRHYGAWEYT
jgi:fructoselysine 6-kinase